MIRRFYDKTIEKAHDPRSQWIMYFMAFTESFFLPIPPDIFILPIVLARPNDAYKIAAYNTFWSVLGGIIGYGIGYVLVDLANNIIHYYGFQSAYHSFITQFQKWGFWVIVLKGFTPIPFKLVTITAGLAHLSFVPFLLASIIARSSRFFILCFLLKHFGPSAKDMIERYFTLIFWSMLLLIALGIYALNFI
jgi:membrane protein YqaA with SNARE-associated domain